MDATVFSRALPRTNRGAAGEATAGLGAALFDVDGVIADTARLHTSAWRRLAEEEGLPFDEDCADALRGLSREASLRRLLDGRPVPDETFAAMTARKNAYYTEALREIGPSDAMDGAAALISEFAAMGIRRAAVSLSRNARAVLDRLELTDRFDAVVDGCVIGAAGDGALDRYGRAAAALRVEPGRCLVIEDSAGGIAVARNLGMKTVGIGSPERLCAADLVFESLRGVRARNLCRWLWSRENSCRAASPVV